MGLVEEIIKSVEDLAEGHNTQRDGDYAVGSAFFPPVDYEKVWARVKKKLLHYAGNGELIESDISRGEITDSGILGFRIVKGRLAELYIYEDTEAVFVRLYHLSSDAREWLALYIDTNKRTPWWTPEERSGR